MQISKTGLFRQAVKLPLPGQLFFFVLFSGPSTALPCIDWERGGGISRPSERNGCCDETLSRFRQLRRVLSGLPVPAALLSAAHARHGGPNGSHRPSGDPWRHRPYRSHRAAGLPRCCGCDRPHRACRCRRCDRPHRACRCRRCDRPHRACRCHRCDRPHRACRCHRCDRPHRTCRCRRCDWPHRACRCRWCDGPHRGLPVPPVPPVRLAPLGLPGLPALLARPVPPGLPERSLRRRRWRMRQARRTL